MSETVYKKKERIRPPRVHIQYEVELNGATVKKELPFVLGVISDLSGQPKEALPRLKDRQLVTIDRDNFDAVLSSMQPRLAFKVDNALAGDDSQLSVQLTFNKLEDFEPEHVAKQIQPLAELLKARTQLKDLLSRTEANDRLEEQLQALFENEELRTQVGNALSSGGTDSGEDR
jgi:type VI secretion system protein ImpB